MPIDSVRRRVIKRCVYGLVCASAVGAFATARAQSVREYFVQGIERNASIPIRFSIAPYGAEVTVTVDCSRLDSPGEMAMNPQVANAGSHYCSAVAFTAANKPGDFNVNGRQPSAACDVALRAACRPPGSIPVISAESSRSLVTAVDDKTTEGLKQTIETLQSAISALEARVKILEDQGR